VDGVWVFEPPPEGVDGVVIVLLRLAVVLLTELSLPDGEPDGPEDDPEPGDDPEPEDDPEEASPAHSVSEEPAVLTKVAPEAHLPVESDMAASSCPLGLALLM